MNKLIIVFYSIIESFIRNISGGIGQRIRYQYYKRRLKSCGKNLRIDIGVTIQDPDNIEIGDNVWIMPYSIIIAKPRDLKISNRIEKNVENQMYEEHHNFDDTLKIGSEIQIGAYSIINGYGGLIIKSRVTFSARVSIYSYSHYYCDEENKSKITYANSMVRNGNIACIRSPIVIEDGVWLGLGVSVFGGNICENSFISAHSVVNNNIEKNSYASGISAKKIKERFDI